MTEGYLTCRKSFSRRNFALLVGGVVGAGAIPFRARAANVEALALTCIDYRLVDDTVRFFEAQHLTNEYDQVALAGASLAAVSPKFPSSNAAFWDHVDIAKQLHHVKKVVFVDHRDCGAYKVAFGKEFAAARDPETAQHKSVMLQASATLAQKHPDLGCEGYLMALDGTAERLA
jgi:carbonic anhydrase